MSHICFSITTVTCKCSWQERTGWLDIALRTTLRATTTSNTYISDIHPFMRLIQNCTNVSHLMVAACFETTLRQITNAWLRRWWRRNYWKIYPHLPYGVTLMDGRSQTSFTRTSTLYKRAAWTISKVQPALKSQTVDTILPKCFRVVPLCLNAISRDVVTLMKLEAGTTTEPGGT